MKRFTKLLIAVAIVAMAIPAFAAVENIKVGGDITISGVKRVNFDDFFNDNEDFHFLQTSTRVYVNATLTEGVEAMVRLLNERTWATRTYSLPYYSSWDERECNYMQLDLAYIKVSDLLTPGLTLTVGKQEIQLGEGLVVGSAYLPNNYYPNDAFWMGEDLGLNKAFDAIRLDYVASGAPVDVTGFVAKIAEQFDSSNDLNLYGVNVGFGMDVARLEGYYVRLQNMDDTDENVTTVGIRATGEWAGFGLKGEYAKQLGQWDGWDNTGWALLLGGKYTFPSAQMGSYIKANLNLYSGYDGGSDNSGWITYFPSNVAQRIGAINYAWVTMWGQSWLSNAQIINIGGGLRPVEKIGLSLDWFNINLMEEIGPSDTGIGNEIDAALTYDFTEDLSLGIQYGYMMTGDFFDNFKGDNNPWQLIGSMKLVF